MGFMESISTFIGEKLYIIEQTLIANQSSHYAEILLIQSNEIKGITNLNQSDILVMK